MDFKTAKTLELLRNKKVGVFVDDSNLYHAYRKAGWRVDFGKLRTLLEQYCNLQFIHYHLAIPHKNDDVAHGTDRFLRKIGSFVILKSKDLKYTPVAGKFAKKADVDVEITLDVVRTVDQLDMVVIMSGDSDFVALREYVLQDKKRQILFLAFEKNMAWELKYGWHLFLDDIKDRVGIPILI